MMQHWLTKHEKHVFFAVVLAGLLVLVFWYHRDQVLVSQEAAVRSRVGIDLLEGDVKGRQGLIGSLKWEPLPTMLLLPLVKIPMLGPTGLAACVVNAVVAAFTLTLLNNWWRRFGIPRPIRFPLLILYQMSPPVLAAVLTGSSATIMLLILMAGAYFLADWLFTLDVRSLAYLGSLGGLAIVTLYPSVVLVAVMTVLIAVRVWRRRERSFRSATLLVYLIPSLYTALLWFMANWLIMGDPLFFLRGIATKARFLAEMGDLDLDWVLYLMPLAPLLAAWIVKAGAEKGVRNLLPVGPEGASHKRFLTPFSARRFVTVLVAVLVLLASIAWPYVTEYHLTGLHGLSQAGSRESYFVRNEEQLAQVDEIIAYLSSPATRQAEAKVFVSGYTGYQFIAREEKGDRSLLPVGPEGASHKRLLSPFSSQFVHLMTVDFARIQRETRGQDLYFLVPRPSGVTRWEDINLRVPELFDDYLDVRVDTDDVRMEFMRAEGGGRWPDWHLLRVIRVEKPQR